ncbi:MAG: oligosaccharide flippase family protein [Flavobacteriales bacterium]|nr:oligosaccharide flippase family protein [Flavobacteriales bacterium]
MNFLKSDFLKNSSLLFSSTGIAQLISFLIIPILARIYSPAEHGVFTVFASVVSICIAFTGLRYDQAIVVEDDHHRAKHLAFLSIGTTLIWVVLFTVIIGLFGDQLYHLFNTDDSFPWLMWLPIAIAAAGCTEIMVMWLNRSRKYKKLASNRVWGMASGSAYKLLHPFQGMVKGNGLVIGQVIGHVLQLLVLVPLKSLRSIRVDWSVIKDVAKRYKSFPLLATPSALINIVGTYLPVFLIAHFFDESTTGYYGNATKLAFIPMSAVGHAVGQVYFERLARLKNDITERDKLSMDLLKFLFWLAVVPVTLLMIWGDTIVPFILGKDWQLSGTIAQVTVLFYFVMYFTGPFSAAFEVFDKLHRQLWFTAIFTVVTIGAMYVVLRLTDSLILALTAHAFVGILTRLAMLYDCFRLLEQRILMQVLKGILVVGGLTLLNLGIKYLVS